MKNKDWQKLEPVKWDKEKGDWNFEPPYDGRHYPFRNRYVDYDTCYYYDQENRVFRNAHGSGHCDEGFLIDNGAEWISHWGDAQNDFEQDLKDLMERNWKVKQIVEHFGSFEKVGSHFQNLVYKELGYEEVTITIKRKI